MKLADVAKTAFAMPLTDPAYPRGPYKFYNREFVVINYQTDPDALREVVPEPLEVIGDTVNYEFIRMPIRPALATIPRPAKSSLSASA